MSAATSGILPSQAIRRLIADGGITATQPIPEEQIQPASLDLRLGSVAWRVRASFLPGPGATVADKLARYAMHEIPLGAGAVLESGCVYIVPLMETLALDRGVTGMANPKSSSGRLDIFTRLITDRAQEFERVPAGYKGPLYVEIAPKAFSVIVREGSRLNQLRLRRGRAEASGNALQRMHALSPLVDRDLAGRRLAEGVPLTVDLHCPLGGRLVGFRARRHTPLIDVDRENAYDPFDFWEPITSHADDGVILVPGEFYILASAEAVSVPYDHAAEMVAYDTLVGEFRVHYAGFFDPAFGHSDAGATGSRAVLEVRSHEAPFLIEHGQIMGHLRYERLTEAADKVYGAGIGSSYQRQTLKLSKHFRALDPATI